MSKPKSLTYILNLKIKTNKQQEAILNKRMEIGRQIYNTCLGLALKRYKAMSESKKYRKIKNKLKIANHKFHNSINKKNQSVYKKERDMLYKQLNSIYREFKLDNYGIVNTITLIYKPFNKNIDNKTAQAIGDRVYKAVSKLLEGDKVQFKSYGEFNSLEGKWNKSGLKFKNETKTIEWNKLSLPVIIKQNDIYAHLALEDRVKYVRIVRKMIRGKYKFYAQLVMEGIPPKKYDKETGEIKQPKNDGVVGLDIGTQTLAVSSHSDVKLLELAPNIDNIEREKRILQRKLDRQRRANNLNNFNEDGTIKKGVRNNGKLEKLTWIKSNKYIKTQLQLKELHRKQADIRKQDHEKMANYILTLGNEVKVEDMNYKGLQKRSKETTVNQKTGKFNKKKRFGKSLANKAPSMFLTILNRKLNYQGDNLLKINTRTVKASQYNHFTDEYNKKELNDRWNEGINLQRDLYSAFLIMNVNTNLDKVNRDLCALNYIRFKELHDLEIERLNELKLKGLKLISSMGI